MLRRLLRGTIIASTYMSGRSNILLKLEMNGESKLKIELASRIKIDGQGCLLVYENPAVTPEKIFIDRIRAFSIRSLSDSSRQLRTYGRPPVRSSTTSPRMNRSLEIQPV